MASLFGAGAGLAGTAIWCVIRIVMHMELGIVAMLVGYIVGKAVRKGSGGWGGRRYQVLAVLITYACISATFVPVMVEAIRKKAGQAHQEKLAAPRNDEAAEKPDAAKNGRGNADNAPVKPLHADRSFLNVVVALATLFALCLAIPVMVGIHDPIMLIIFGIGLWEAWRFAARRVLPIVGPLQLGPRPA